jgi:glycosyltransferase involved in cell wall biosynthesis
MRILHVLPTYLPAVRYGGPVFAVHSLCRALVSRGHEIEVYTTNLDGSNNIPGISGATVKLDGVQVRYFSSNFLRRLSWAPSLAHALSEKVDSFDLVHIHSVFLWPTWAAARAARKVGVPYIISPRGMLIKELIARRNRLIKSAWLNLIEKTNLEQAAAIHVTSELEAEELSHFEWQLPKVVTISNGVDDPNSDNSANHSADVKELVNGAPYILFLGRLSWKKGLDRLLRAFALTSHGKLVIAGTDDENMIPNLSQIVQNLQIRDRVYFLPRTIVDCDKEKLFAAAQVFVLPSYSENFGNTVLEAMRRGLPVVVTPEVGAAEIVVKSHAGIVANGDPQALSQAISRLTENVAYARSMGQAGQRYVLEYYRWPTIAAQMESLYESLRFPRAMTNKNLH